MSNTEIQNQSTPPLHLDIADWLETLQSLIENAQAELRGR